MKRWKARHVLGLALVTSALSGCVSLPKFFRKGDGKVVKTEAGTCVFLAPENQLHPLAGCETPAGYQFRVGDKQYAYTKAQFQNTLKDRLAQMVRRTNYPWKSLATSSVEVWLEAPTFDPGDATLKIVVMSPAGNFALPLALNIDEWTLDTASIERLGEDHYPSLGAKKAGVLAVLARVPVTAARFDEFLKASGVLEARTASGALAVREVRGEAPLLVLATEPFAEPAVAQQLMKQRAAKSFLTDVRYIQAGEKEGYKAKIFSFSW